MQFRTYNSILFFLCIGVSVITTGISVAETVALGAFKDSSLINNFQGNAANGSGPLFAGATGNRGPGAIRALLAFDIASNVPAGSTVTGVELMLNLDKAGSASGVEDYTLHKVEQDWGEGSSSSSSGTGAVPTTGDATWLHTFHATDTWNNPGGDFVSTPSAVQSIADLGAVTWGSTSLLVADVQSWLDDPGTNFGWILIGDESVSGSSRRFHSRESAANTPQLTVTFTPVPEPCAAAKWLLALAGGAAVWRRQR